MSKSKPQKKVVVTTTPKTPPTPSRSRQAAVAPKAELIFGKQTYLWMGIGAVLITFGMLLMSGGHMSSPDVWDENLIYSFRRTVLAPIVILAGLIVEIYAIFKK